MNPEWTVPTGELSDGRQARSPLGSNGPKVESPPVSPGLPLLEVPVPPPKAVTFLAGVGVAGELAALLTAAAAGTGAG